MGEARADIQDAPEVPEILKGVEIKPVDGVDNIFTISKGGHDLITETIGAALAKIQNENGTLKHIIPQFDSGQGHSIHGIIVVVEPNSSKP